MSVNKRAYCCLLYGSKPSEQIVANALAVACSLIDSKYRIVLLVTSDVPREVFSLLEGSGLFGEIRTIDYIMGNVGLYKKDWFREVFTKLHVFDLVEYDKVMFLDLDMVVNSVSEMDKLFELDCMFGAMENSKNTRHMLQHGESMRGGKCRLFNAGVILVTPNEELFSILREDVESESPDHVPGMTPEQFYLARVLGNHMHYIGQQYNFEVQYHGGVPLTDFWKGAEIGDIVTFHFSGGSPLQQLVRRDFTNWGCQLEKFYTRKIWETEFSNHARSVASGRAKYAFAKWGVCYALAVRSFADMTMSEEATELLERLRGARATRVGDYCGTDNSFIVVAVTQDTIVGVNETTMEIVHLPIAKPKRPPPTLSS